MSPLNDNVLPFDLTQLLLEADIEACFDSSIFIFAINDRLEAHSSDMKCTVFDVSSASSTRFTSIVEVLLELECGGTIYVTDTDEGSPSSFTVVSYHPGRKR